MVAVEGAIKKVQELFNSRMNLVRTGLALHDAKIGVMNLILADIVTESLVLKDNQVDYRHYYQKYEDICKEQEKQRVAAEEAKKKAADPVKKDSGPEEFGGDYGTAKKGSPVVEGQQDSRGTEDLGDGQPAPPEVPEVPQNGIPNQEQPG